MTADLSDDDLEQWVRTFLPCPSCGEPADVTLQRLSVGSPKPQVQWSLRCGRCGAALRKKPQ